MDGVSIVGVLVNILSFIRITKWSVDAHVWDILYVGDNENMMVSMLRVTVCNTGKSGITLYPLQYQVSQNTSLVEPYFLCSWTEHNEHEDRRNPRLEPGELATCNISLPIVDLEDNTMIVKVLIKTHCGKRTTKKIRNHPLLNKQEIDIRDGRTINEYMEDEFQGYPI